MASDWHLVLDPDGTVVASLGGAPAEWIDSRLIDRRDVPAELRNAALLITNHLVTAGLSAASRPLTLEGGQVVHLVALDAIPLRRRPTDLRVLLPQTLEVVKDQARAVDVSVRILFDPSVPQIVSVDAEKLAWVVVALAGNALRYVRSGSRLMPGGTITVHAAHDHATNEVVIEVKDDGPGIPSETLARLFRRTPSEQHRGGLGLALVQDILVAHGGGVEVRTSTDVFEHGTTIRLSLPTAVPRE